MFASISSLWRSNPSRRFDPADRATGLPRLSMLCDLENCKDKTTRILDHLIKLNHSNNALVDIETGCHNNTADILVAAYRSNFDGLSLNSAFEDAAKSTSKWTDPPSELSKNDWMDFYGQLSYQRAFLDYFEDEVAENGYEWRDVVSHYLFWDQNNLFGFLFNQKGLPLRRLASALEVSSCALAMESLALFSVCPSSRETLLASKRASRSCPRGSKSMLQVLHDLASRHRKLKHQQDDSDDLIESLWTELEWSSSTQILTEMQEVAVLLYLSDSHEGNVFDWLLTSCHALLIVLPSTPLKMLELAQGQWWWLCLFSYLEAGCPEITPQTEAIEQTSQTDWHDIQEQVASLCPTDCLEAIQKISIISALGQVSQKPKLFLLGARKTIADAHKTSKLLQRRGQ